MSITKLKSQTVKSGEYATVSFDTAILNSGIALQGFSVSFGEKVDHHVRELVVSTNIAYISGKTVGITATSTMEDNSQHVVNGEATALIMAECDV